MANKNKKVKEPVYRDPRGGRWRFISDESQPWGACWLMVRIRDGYRSYWPPNEMTLEK